MKYFSSVMVQCQTIGSRVGLLTIKLLHIEIIPALESARAGQERRMCWRLPSWFEQPGSLHKPLGLSLVQCLESRSVLYLPDSILAVISALLTSKGLPAWDQIGWGLERDMKAGLKNSREGRISASDLSFCSKKSVTLDLHLVFHWSLVGGNWRTVSGSGR